jgi:hypothetical protein
MTNHNPEQQQIIRHRPRRVWASAAVLTLALTQVGYGQAPTPPPLPAGLEVDAPNVPFLLGRGVGTQNYECQPADTIGHVDWVLFTPQATLFDDQGGQLTTHFFSPNPNPADARAIRATWQDSRDSSAVWAKRVAASTDPQFVKAGAVAWVKLEVVGTQAGPTGGAGFVGTTFVQRVNTVGGLAPATGCSLPTDIGRRQFVPYTADYIFYRR